MICIVHFATLLSDAKNLINEGNVDMNYINYFKLFKMRLSKVLKGLSFIIAIIGICLYLILIIFNNYKEKSKSISERQASSIDSGYKPDFKEERMVPGGSEDINKKEKQEGSNRLQKLKKDLSSLSDYNDINRIWSARREGFRETADKTIDDYDRFNISNTKISDIAYYDDSRKGYVLTKIELYQDKDISNRLVSLLKLLNTEDMPQDFFRSKEYQAVYEEIDFFFDDTYIWPYFTNNTSKTNFFLYLFTRYAADNKNWKAYREGVSDCSQFTQRIYMFLSPDEIFLPDKDYFQFLFSTVKNRSERIKLCNKIPDIFYTTVYPYLLKDSVSKWLKETGMESHAMLSFAPNNNIKDWLIGEPQNGSFQYFGKNTGDIMPCEYKDVPLICNLGKIFEIDDTSSHEAKYVIKEIYFFPNNLFGSDDAKKQERKKDFDYNPILIAENTKPFFYTISSYIRNIVNYESVDDLKFLHSLESIIYDRELSIFEIEDSIKTSVEITMYAIMDLNRSEIRRIQEQIKNFEHIDKNYLDSYPNLNIIKNELDYLFRIKLDPLLDIPI